jgi:nitrite reductase (NADH) large subunit
VLYGDVADGPWYFELIQTGADISAIRNQLLFGQAQALALAAA